MAKFRMVLLGSQRVEINSKATNEEKLKYFTDEVKKCKIEQRSKSYIKIYRSGKKFAEYRLSKEDIDELSLKWINYTKK